MGFNPFAETDDPFDVVSVLRRLLLWTIICSISAAPSFFCAAHDFDQAAMVLGVSLFILAYTAFTSTPGFLRFRGRPFVRRTLYIGYGTRLGLSVFCLLFPLSILADAFPGLASIAVIEATGLDPHSFFGTLATTIVQGAFLNCLISIFMLLVYGVQRASMQPPLETRRGFEVVLPATPIPAVPLGRQPAQGADQPTSKG